MVRANIDLTRREEGIFRSYLSRMGFSINGFISRLVREEIAKLRIEEEKNAAGSAEAN